MLNRASVTELWAIPPVRLASHSAAWLATGMNVGIGSLGVLFGLQPERAERALAGAQGDRVVERLHHQHDDRAPRPMLGEQHLREALGVQQDLGEQLQGARQARAVADEQRVEAVHRVAVVAVGDGLDVGVRVGVDRGGDRDALDQVLRIVLGHGHREDRLAVRAHQLAQARGDPPERAVQAAALEQLVRAQRSGGDDDAARALDPAFLAQPRAGAHAFDLVAVLRRCRRRAGGRR